MQKIIDVSMNSCSLFLSTTITIASIVFSIPARAGSIVTQWNNVALEAIRDTRPGPPLVARGLFIVHNAVFDAWSAYDSQAISTTSGGTYRRPLGERTLANKQEAISYSAYRTLVDLFPSQKTVFDAQLTNLGYDPNNTTLNPTTAAGIGNLAAQDILAIRHNDGSNQLGNLNGGSPYSDYTDYVPVNTPTEVNDINHWQPLRVSNGQGGFVEQKFIVPFWGNVTPFALTSYDQFPLPNPHIYDPNNPNSPESQAFIAQAQDILDISANLTDRQKTIAEYWADGPSSELPPGHWNLFAQTISDRDNHDLDADTKLFFALNGAMFDASVATWGYKREFDYVRPITAIHELFQDQQVRAWGGPNQGTQTILGQDWQPYQAPTIVTPPFAEYVSGHTSYSNAGAEILKRFTGSDAFNGSVTILGSDSIHFETGLTDATLSWATFSDAAAEAGISRLYGGIHFSDGNINAEAFSRQVAGQSWLKAQSFINPTSVPEPYSNYVFGVVGIFLGVGSSLKHSNRNYPQNKKHKFREAIAPPSSHHESTKFTAGEGNGDESITNPSN